MIETLKTAQKSNSYAETTQKAISGDPFTLAMYSVCFCVSTHLGGLFLV
jgi:hypothetical protein